MPDTDPLLQIDPFAVLMDARQQLLATVEALAEAEPERVAMALGAVASHDDALCEIASAYAEGDRTFEAITMPADRLRPATVEEASRSRSTLFDTLSATQTAFDVEVLVPWASAETWHVHLIGLAMFEGAQAHALREGDPIPAILGRQPLASAPISDSIGSRGTPRRSERDEPAGNGA